MSETLWKIILVSLSVVYILYMETEVEAFVQTPADELLDEMTKEQLLQLAAHYEMELSTSQKRSKDGIK